MTGTYRTAFNGAVRGKVVSVTSTGVILGGQNGLVREINARYLDPVKTHKGRTRRFTPKPRAEKPVAETPTPRVSKPKPVIVDKPKPVTVGIREAKMTDFERLRAAGLLTTTDRTQYADK